MVRERIADDIYVFTSREYAQVTAGAILTKEGVILIDTLYFPEETRAIKEFLEDRLGHRIRYVINTHYHADHTQGTYLFPGARVVSHTLCKQYLDSKGREGLREAKLQNQELGEVRIILPDFIFEDEDLTIHLGGKTIKISHMPGHTKDLVGVYVTNNRILFASDNMMPVPTIFDGDYDDLVGTYQRMIEMAPDTVVQGHGEVILRGEIRNVISDNLSYLETIKEKVTNVLNTNGTENDLREIDIESCGKSRIPLNGLVSDLHHANLQKLYSDLKSR